MNNSWSFSILGQNVTYTRAYFLLPRYSNSYQTKYGPFPYSTPSILFTIIRRDWLYSLSASIYYNSIPSAICSNPQPSSTYTSLNLTGNPGGSTTDSKQYPYQVHKSDFLSPTDQEEASPPPEVLIQTLFAKYSLVHITNVEPLHILSIIGNFNRIQNVTAIDLNQRVKRLHFEFKRNQKEEKEIKREWRLFVDKEKA